MQYIIAGTGGQGILFTSKILGTIAIDKRLPLIGSEVHGIAQRGGSVISHFKIGNYKGPLISPGHADVVIAFDQGEGIQNLHFLRDGGIFLVNANNLGVFENQNLKQYQSTHRIKFCIIQCFELLKRYLNGNLLFLNVLMAGAASGIAIDGFEENAVKKALTNLSPSVHLEKNLKAFELGKQAVIS